MDEPAVEVTRELVFGRDVVCRYCKGTGERFIKLQRIGGKWMRTYAICRKCDGKGVVKL